MPSSKSEPRGRLKEYEDRWERAAGGRDVKNLEGDWKVERLSGPLPMPFVWKRIRGGRGETRVLPRSWRALGPPFEPKFPFELEQREEHVTLIYRPPLSFLVDELRLEADGSWLGRAKAAGLRYAWFRMIPIKDPKGLTHAVGA